jgi:hypothetical protein
MCLAPAFPSTSLCSARVVTVVAFHLRYFVNYFEIILQPIFQEHFLLRNSQIITHRAL